MHVGRLDPLRDFVGGRGCVVRRGYMVYSWGDVSKRCGGSHDGLTVLTQERIRHMLLGEARRSAGESCHI